MREIVLNDRKAAGATGKIKITLAASDAARIGPRLRAARFCERPCANSRSRAAWADASIQTFTAVGARIASQRCSLLQSQTNITGMSAASSPNVIGRSTARAESFEECAPGIFHCAEAPVWASMLNVDSHSRASQMSDKWTTATFETSVTW